MEASLQTERQTDELAIMVDAFRPLHMAIGCEDIDDPTYMHSWDQH